MNKYIEQATIKIVQRMEKNRKEYNEARASYNDTGYDKYYKKMCELESEYNELKNFINPQREEVGESLYSKLDFLQKILKTVRNKVEYMECDFPANSHLLSLKELLKDVT